MFHLASNKSFEMTRDLLAKQVVTFPLVSPCRSKELALVLKTPNPLEIQPQSGKMHI
jgi:hypothetical protein